MSSLEMPSLRFAPSLLTVFFVTVMLVLIPFFIWGETLEQWANGMLAKTDSIVLVSVAVIVLLSADILLPLPSSLIALGAGIKLGFWLGVLPVFTGLMIGNLVGYGLGRRYGARFAEKMAGQSTRLPDHITGIVVCLTRAVPVLAEAVVVTAGAGRLPFRSFIPAIMLGNLGFAVSYCWVGHVAGTQGSVLLFMLATMIGPLLGYLIFVFFQQRTKARRV